MTPEDAKKMADTQINTCKSHLFEARTAIEFAVLATPTGPRRTELTEAHLHMLIAIEKLKA